MPESSSTSPGRTVSGLTRWETAAASAKAVLAFFEHLLDLEGVEEPRRRGVVPDGSRPAVLVPVLVCVVVVGPAHGQRVGVGADQVHSHLPLVDQLGMVVQFRPNPLLRAVSPWPGL